MTNNQGQEAYHETSGQGVWTGPLKAWHANNNPPGRTRLSVSNPGKAANNAVHVLLTAMTRRDKYLLLKRYLHIFPFNYNT